MFLNLKKALAMLAAAALPLAATPQEADDSKHIGRTAFADGLFDAGSWCRPFWADMYSTITRAELAYSYNAPEYDWGRKGDAYRPYIFANIGVDVPVWAGTFANERCGLSVTIPYLVDVWLDMFERTTAPVINTAYRFGAPEVNFIRHLSGSLPWIASYSLKLVPFKHECSHIGDDLTLMRSSEGIPLKNVNVSYNYWQVESTINDPMFSLKETHSLRIALLGLYNRKKGWYELLAPGGDANLVKPSQRPFEFWVQYQYQSAVGRHRLQRVASVEVRSRTRYNYPLYRTAEDNPAQWTSSDILGEVSLPAINLMLGVRYRNPRAVKLRSVGVALRAYRGMNPYGQFRSIPKYEQYGVMLVVE
ncbi:MAG: hypothetical protein LBH84_06075 [Prevotellaceae bacterium]|jgi:hypothetical protein|nr:hypothetical protein [Prevotellaceae bacterium]